MTHHLKLAFTDKLTDDMTGPYIRPLSALAKEYHYESKPDKTPPQAIKDYMTLLSGRAT